MPRATNNPAAKARRKKYLKRAKGFVGGKSNQYVIARETVDRALAYAYRDPAPRSGISGGCGSRGSTPLPV
jgi:large subunit ribosomal protein L20